MIVYVITTGEYSDYGIEAVVLEKEKAEELKKLYSNDWGVVRIETYDTDDYYVEKGKFYEVKVGKRSAIHVRETGVTNIKDRNKVSFGRNWFTNVEEYSVLVKAKDEEHAKKIGADLVAKYKAEKQGV